MPVSNRAKAIGATAGAVMTASAAVVAQFEGIRTSPYLDIVGVRTVCFGETQVQMRQYTPEECKGMLAKSLVKYDNGMKACLNRDIPDGMHVAFISATYNIGIRAFCHSSMARLVNAGDLRGACMALGNWDRAGGAVIQGLHKRREAEIRICLRGLPT